MLARVTNIMTKEWRQLRRDPRMFPLVIIAPLLQLLLFGYGATFTLRDLPMVACDQDRTRLSREYLRSFTHSGYFALVGSAGSYREIEDALGRGRAKLAVVIPTGFARKVKAAKGGSVQIIVDGTDSNSGTVGMSYAAVISQRFATDLLLERVALLLPQARGVIKEMTGGIIEGRVRVWYNPELRSVNYMVPGVVAAILLVMTMILTSLSIVKEKELGTIESLIVTPLRPLELIAGKLLPFVVIGFVDVTLVLCAATLWFQVPIAGSVLLLFFLSGLFMLATLGLGLFISTISRTQNQAQLTAFFLMLPMTLLSGFIFPIENMPTLFQYLTYLSPLRYFLVIIRGIFLKGSGLSLLWPQAVALVLLGGSILTLSLTRFRKQLD